MISDEVIKPNLDGLKPKRRRKITMDDCKAVANLIATRKCSETEACLMLDLKPKQWNLWKNRHKNLESFESLIARIRGDYLTGLVDCIDKAGDDSEIRLPNGKIIDRKGDWRAKAWIAEKIDKRFNDTPAIQAPQVSIQIGIIHDQLKKVIGFTDVKQIEDKTS